MLNLLRDQFFVLNVFIYLFLSRLSHDTSLDISATAFLKTKNYFFFLKTIIPWAICQIK